jgi:23S rRNA pseudouridine955/2504/2580 synthase
LRRLMLHAARLELTLPDGDKLQVDAPLDEATATSLQQLSVVHPQ